MDLTEFKSELSFGNKLLRLVWGIAWATLFLPSPRVLHSWRAFLLRRFGAQIGRGTRVYNTAKIYYPPHLEIADHVVIGPHVDVYCVAPVKIEQNSMISQYSYLCAATHDYRQSHLPLIPAPISIGKRTWVCARSFIGPGVNVGDDCVVGACAVVVKDVEPGMVVAGNPAKVIKRKSTDS